MRRLRIQSPHFSNFVVNVWASVTSSVKKIKILLATYKLQSTTNNEHHMLWISKVSELFVSIQRIIEVSRLAIGMCSGPLQSRSQPGTSRARPKTLSAWFVFLMSR